MIVTDEDRVAARRSIDDGSRGVVPGAIALATVALLLSQVVTLALPDSIDGFAGFLLQVVLPVALCSPLLWLVADRAKRKYLDETA